MAAVVLLLLILKSLASNLQASDLELGDFMFKLCNIKISSNNPGMFWFYPPLHPFLTSSIAHVIEKFIFTTTVLWSENKLWVMLSLSFFSASLGIPVDVIDTLLLKKL